MKFSLFAHMERLHSGQTYRELYEDFLSLCVLADEGGMRAVWTGEHHAMDFTIAPNPLITIADLAGKLKNVRLGTGTIVAPFWHPIKLAGEIAMTDIITHGRLEIGIARGAYSYEYERLMPGMDAKEAGARLREILPAIKQLWSGNYTHDGAYYSFPETTSTPKPQQASGPPIWVAARDPNSHEFAVANNCNVQVTPLWQDYHEVVELMRRFQAARNKCNGKFQPKIMILQHTFVGANEEEIEMAANCLSRFYCHFGAWFKNERAVQQALMEPLTDNEIAAMEMYSPKVMRENLVIGTAQEIIDLLKRYEDLGFDEFSYWIDSGMSTKQKRISLMRFIDDVMPAFQ